MSLHYLNVRLFLTISIILLGAILLFLQFGRIFSLPFHRSANGSLLSGGDSLHHVFNQTLGVSKSISIQQLVARAISQVSDVCIVPEDLRHQSTISYRPSRLDAASR